MSCFSLPKTTCKNISRSIARFWWRHHETDHGVHWISWKNMCKPREAGGMGFKELQGFNKALLGKQIWRIASNPDSLVARTLQGRYFKKTTILTAKKGHGSSYAWRSIISAQPLMKLGMQKNFGDGSTIRMFEDPWVLAPEPRPPVAKQGIDTKEYQLAHFKEELSDEWNMHRLKEVFEDLEVAQICKIKPGKHKPAHVFSWIYQPNGQYTVKSGYHIWWSNIHMREAHLVSEQPSFTPIYREIWSLRTTPKIKHLLWRIMLNSLPSGEKLKHKRITKQPECQRCGHQIENVNHIFFTCPFARVTWALSSAGSIFFPHPSESIYENMALCLWEIGKLERTHYWPWVLWHLWKSRNKFVLENIDVSPASLIALAESQAQEWRDGQHVHQTKPATKNGTTNVSQGTVKYWQKPVSNTLKCNVDASWTLKSDTCGVGWILRNSEGHVRFYGAKSYPNVQSALQAEATGLTWAMSCISNMQLSDVIFEIDNLTVFKAIQDPGSWPSLDNSVQDICSILRRNQSYQMSFTGREANEAADKIAKTIKPYPIYSAYIDVMIPSWLSPIVRKDQNSDH